MTAEEILEAINKMETEERWKLLNKMFHKYYNKDGLEYTPIDFDY